MKNSILVILAVVAIWMAACNNNRPSQNEATSSDITYAIADNYFVNNTVEEVDNPKIESSEKFNEIFGMATRMGAGGKPTPIDFDTQFVIAIVPPETDFETSIEVISLQKNNRDEIVCSYKIKTGKRQTFTSQPFLALIVDKANKGNLVLNKLE